MLPVVWDVSGVNTIWHQGAKLKQADRYGPLSGAETWCGLALGQGRCLFLSFCFGEVQIAQRIFSLEPAVSDHFLIDRHWAWALQNAMSKSPTEFSPAVTLAGAALVRLRAAPLGFSRCVFSASPMLVQCHQEMVPDNLRGKYNEQQTRISHQERKRHFWLSSNVFIQVITSMQ